MKVSDNRISGRPRRLEPCLGVWVPVFEGIDLTLTFLRQKRDQTRRLARIAPVNLGIPGMGHARS